VTAIISFTVNEHENVAGAQRDVTARYDGALLQHFESIRITTKSPSHKATKPYFQAFKPSCLCVFVFGIRIGSYCAISISSNLKAHFWLKGALHKRATHVTQRNVGLLRRIVGESCHYRLLSLNHEAHKEHEVIVFT
jgi:hypothetical protein